MPLLFLLVLVSLQQIVCLQINKNNVVEKYFVKINILGIIIVVSRHFFSTTTLQDDIIGYQILNDCYLFSYDIKCVEI